VVGSCYLQLQGSVTTQKTDLNGDCSVEKCAVSVCGTNSTNDNMAVVFAQAVPNF
jgi:hypothetical protein